MQTEQKRNRKGGNPAWKKGQSVTPEKMFSKENQPSPESKSFGQKKRMTGQKLAQAILAGTFNGDVKLKSEAAKYFEVDPSELTIEAVMHFKQVQKAIEKGDTMAYNALLNRGHGMPAQTNKVEFTDGAVVMIGGKKLE